MSIPKFVVAPTESNPKCAKQVNEQRESWTIYEVEYYSQYKMTELLSHTMIWINHKILCQIKETRKK